MIALKTKYLSMEIKEPETDSEKRLLAHDIAAAMNLLLACQTTILDEETTDGNVYILGRNPGERDH